MGEVIFYHTLLSSKQRSNKILWSQSSESLSMEKRTTISVAADTHCLDLGHTWLPMDSNLLVNGHSSIYSLRANKFSPLHVQIKPAFTFPCSINSIHSFNASTFLDPQYGRFTQMRQTVKVDVLFISFSIFICGM